MKVLNILPFVKEKSGAIGIAEHRGTFAAQAWCLSDEGFDSISGNKFSWIGPDGVHYIDHRNNFLRPTEEEIIKGMTYPIKQIALSLKYISDE